MSSNHYTIIIIHARVPAPSKHCANYNHGDSCYGVPGGHALQRVVHPRIIVRIANIAIPATARRVVAPYRGFVQTSNIVMPSSPRRVAAIADGWCLELRTAPILNK